MPEGAAGHKPSSPSAVPVESALGFHDRRQALSLGIRRRDGYRARGIRQVTGDRPYEGVRGVRMKDVASLEHDAPAGGDRSKGIGDDWAAPGRNRRGQLDP